ncbi:MAG: autotransporter domain-containing protein [Parachlamydiales bacterium]|jgi:hypothetical protein
MRWRGYTFSRTIKKSILLSFSLLSILCGNNVVADSGPLAILGGQGSAPYAAFLNHDGTLTKLNGLPPTGLTYRVAINSSGYGIIGGTTGINAYAALVSPKGTVKAIPGLMSPGEIYTVAINESGNGIIGGGRLLTNVPYAALISKKGNATHLNVPLSGLVYSVAINNSGEGIVGGIGPLNSAYASLVSPGGNVTPLAGLPTTGAIYWVAINDAKRRFIGGQNNASVYAAFIDKQGSLIPVSGLPLGLNYSVAINAKGNAIMGGTSLNLPYAALVAQNGAVKNLNGLPTAPGKIYTVTLNDAGTGLFVGFTTSGPYGSFVAPNGTLTPLVGLPTGDGFLDGVALHSAGVGIVGGSLNNVPFAALAAPNGTLTYLSGLPLDGQINSISIATLDNLVPKHIGPFDSWANTQFALSDALTQHCIMHQGNRRNACSHRLPLLDFELDAGTSSLWLSAFGNYVHEKGKHSFHGYSNNIAGALLGLDYKGIQDVVLGGGLAYAYNSVRYFEDYGSASINQESAVLYASWNNPCFYMNAALWGGHFHTSHHRRSLGFITSKAKPCGWNLTPHFEISSPFIFPSAHEIIVDPFITLDWANNWQSHYREHGSSGFNIKLNDLHASIFRSELGLRFFETFHCRCGRLLLEEKISYVNKTPIHKGKGRASFIGAASSFGVETLNFSSQNQGNVQLHVEYLPSCIENIYSSFDYQGGFGSSFQSHMLTLMIGQNF